MFKGVHAYESKDSSWSQIGQDIDGEYADDYFGYSVSLGSDGQILVIGAQKTGGGICSDIFGSVNINKNLYPREPLISK